MLAKLANFRGQLKNLVDDGLLTTDGPKRNGAQVYRIPAVKPTKPVKKKKRTDAAIERKADQVLTLAKDPKVVAAARAMAKDMKELRRLEQAVLL